jgi:hypothetical protein
MRFFFLLFFFLSLQTFLEAKGESSLRSVLLDTLFSFFDGEEGREQIKNDPFERQTRLYCYNSVSNLLNDPEASRGALNEMTYASWTESKKFRLGTEVQCELHMSAYKSCQMCPKAIREEGITFRLHQPLVKEFRFGQLAIDEKITLFQQKIDLLEQAHEISQALIEPITAYWDLVFAKERVNLWKKALKQFEASYQEFRSKGINVELSDLSKLLSEMAFAKRFLMSAESEVVLCKTHLEHLIKRTICLEELDPFPKRRFFNEYECLQTAFRERKDLRALNLTDEGVCLLILRKKNERLPSVDLKMHYKVDDRNLRTHQGGVEVSFSYPTYKEKRNVSQEMRIKGELLLDISKKKGEIRIEIGDLFRELEGDFKRDFGAYTINESTKKEEERLKRERDLAIWEGRLEIAMGVMVDIDFETESIKL